MRKMDQFYIEAERLYSSLQVYGHLSLEVLEEKFLIGMEDLLQEHGFEVLESYGSTSEIGYDYFVGFVLNFCGRRVALTKDFDALSFCGDNWHLRDHRIEDYEDDVSKNLCVFFNRRIVFLLDDDAVAHCPMRFIRKTNLKEYGWPVGVVFAFLRGETWTTSDLGHVVPIRPQEIANYDKEVSC